MIAPLDYPVPNRCCTNSSGTPLVSMTFVFTQMSCRIIIAQKNANTYPGANAVTITGKTLVTKAAALQ